MIRMLRIPILLDGAHAYVLRMRSGGIVQSGHVVQVSDTGFHFEVPNEGYTIASFPRTNEDEYDPFTDIPVLENARFNCNISVTLAMGWASMDFVQYGVSGKICDSSVKLETGLNLLGVEIDNSTLYGRFELRLSGAGTLIIDSLKVETFPRMLPIVFASRKWRILNPSTQSNCELWGDFHFGSALAKYLRRYGQTVSMPLVPNWNEYSEGEADVNLVLRGKYHEFSPREGAFNILWNISHPSSVSLDEYERYDLVFVASVHYASELRETCRVPVFSVLQCTDHELFNRGSVNEESLRSGIIFVGGGMGRTRNLVKWALESGVPLKLYGPDWDKRNANVNSAGAQIANSELPNLYRSSMVTLNDHWPDMADKGFFNNRLFDALACGTIVLSDYVKGTDELFCDEVLIARNQHELVKKVFNVAAESDHLRKKMLSLDYWHQFNFSFENRVKVILSILDQYLRGI